MKSPYRLWLEWVRPIVLVAAVIFPFRSVIADWNDVPTGSMKPTIVEGDRIFINKLAYSLRVPFTTVHLARWGQPQRGEIVICYAPDDGIRLVKRVVGVPGDVLEVREGLLVINGEPLRYTSLNEESTAASEAPWSALVATEELGNTSHKVMWLREFANQRSFGPVRIPENRYFMMGDNRDNSRDSRSFGFIEASEIVGRATMVVVSMDPQHGYLPRADRLFVDLR